MASNVITCFFPAPSARVPDQSAFFHLDGLHPLLGSSALESSSFWCSNHSCIVLTLNLMQPTRLLLTALLPLLALASPPSVAGTTNVVNCNPGDRLLTATPCSFVCQSETGELKTYHHPDGKKCHRRVFLVVPGPAGICQAGDCVHAKQSSKDV
ncbi:hypothetical protein Hypma_008944 [Hypsizygus marmoreus]|uniref:Uncharacterized protein n=1 Tax=Hypsizygus marmoreus TaxID=39966 RepID=A0A369JPR0_HYPMA|nr:hypothetical protein Hypma_008944 [Hypsizygus marmoreus]